MNAPAVIHIAADHPAFPGHFPGSPLLPGALLLDEILRLLPVSAATAGAPLRLTAVKFRRPVLPDTRLRLQYEPCGDGRVRFELRDDQGVVVDGVAQTVVQQDS